MEHRLAVAMSKLSTTRPCFHSEADFQFALAWQFKVLNPEAEIRLEVPVRVGSSTFKLDILLIEAGSRTALELKYFKAPLGFEHHGETYDLVDAVAHDINRYDAIKDIVRLEHMLAGGAVDAGFAVLLTNQPKYWTPRDAGRRVDEAFGLKEGRDIAGNLTWAEHTGGTSKGREQPIQLAGSYHLKWQDYSDLITDRFGHFRWLCVQAAPGDAARMIDNPMPASRRHPQTPGPKRQYSELRILLERTQGTRACLTFSEIESIVGKLPASARNHRAWWGNHRCNSQAVWLSAGWKVSEADLAGESIVFERK